MAVAVFDVDSSTVQNSVETKVQIAAQKKELRARYRTIATEQWAGAAAAKRASAISQKLKLLLQSYQCVAGYRALASEPNLAELFGSAEIKAHCKVVYPKIENDNIAFFETNDETKWVQNNFGLDEPSEETSRRVETDKIEAYVIPALAFDRKLVRLGRGGGYYDRILANSTALKVGVCSAAQVSDVNLPREEHDQTLDILVTENYLLKLEKKLEPKL